MVTNEDFKNYRQGEFMKEDTKLKAITGFQSKMNTLEVWAENSESEALPLIKELRTAHKELVQVCCDIFVENCTYSIDSNGVMSLIDPGKPAQSIVIEHLVPAPVVAVEEVKVVEPVQEATDSNHDQAEVVEEFKMPEATEGE